MQCGKVLRAGVSFVLLIALFWCGQRRAEAQLPWNWTNFTGWSADNGIWQVGVPPVKSGPGSTYNGAPNCAGTAMTSGSYPENDSSRLITPAINLPTISAGQQILLTFWQWFLWGNDGVGGYSSGSVQVATWNGSSWGSWTTVSNPANGNTPYSGTSGGIWDIASVDLSAYAGQQIEIAFQVNTDDDTDPGWYLDDVAVNVNSVQALPYTQTFETFTATNWQGWSTDDGVWQVGAPTFGPDAAFGGSLCAGTSISTGAYPAGQSSRLITPAMSIPSITSGQQVTLTFWHWFQWGNDGVGGYSSGDIQVSVRNGNTWGPWSTVSNPASGNTVYSGTSGGLWDLVSVDLSAFAGQQIQIAFQQNTDDDTDPGWYFDNVTIAVAPTALLPLNQVITFANFTNAGWQGWWADNGVWQIGVPPSTSGPGSTYNGAPECAGSSMSTGTYPSNQSSRLITPIADLPSIAAGDHIILSFWQWFLFGNDGVGGYTSGDVQVSTWNGSTWTSWQTVSSVYSGSSGGIWSPANVDLSAYAGKQIQIGFQLNTDDDTDPGWYIDDVTVTTPQVNNPIPTLSSLNPASIVAGSMATNITLTGTNFVIDSVAQWNGVNLSTVGTPTGTSLTATIPTSDLTTVGTFNVTVFNPTPGGGTSNSLPFNVVAAGLNVAFTSPAPGSPVTGVVPITGLITDTLASLGTWTLSLSGITLATGTGSSPSYKLNTSLFGDGTHSLLLTEKDAKGNSGNATLTLAINNGGVSSITITRPTAGAAVKGTVTVTGAIHDLTPGTWALMANGVQIGSGTGGSPSVAWDTTKYADGSVTLLLSETDAVGHTASTSEKVTVNNTGISAISISSPSPGQVVFGKWTVTGSITDATPESWILDCSGVQVASGTGTTVSVVWDTTQFSDGSHTLVLTETDAAGNKASATVSVIVNNTGVKSIAITAPASGSAVKGTVAVKGAISDATLGTWNLAVDGSNVATGSGGAPAYSWNTTSLADGSHTLKLTESDLAGHTASASVTITVNNTGATVTITAPAPNAVVKATQTITGTITDATPGTWSLTLDGVPLASGTGMSVSYAWNTKIFANGAHTIKLTETDAAGNSASTTVNVTVSN